MYKLCLQVISCINCCFQFCYIHMINTSSADHLEHTFWMFDVFSMTFDCFLCGGCWTFLFIALKYQWYNSALVLYLPATLWSNKELHGFATSLLWDCIMSSFPLTAHHPCGKKPSCAISLSGLCVAAEPPSCSHSDSLLSQRISKN